MEGFEALWLSMGIANFAWGQLLMMFIGALLIYLAISRGFEPLLLLPIGFGSILANIPVAGLAEHYGSFEHKELFATLLQVEVDQIGAAWKQAGAAMQLSGAQLASDLGYSDGMLNQFYNAAVASGIAPLLIFMGVGALTDFSALIAMPKTLFLGAAAQFGIFATLLGALALNLIPGFEFTLADASAIAIIGGADGPTAIFLASKLAPDLLGAIAVAAYSYMALVPIIQPPIMRALTSEKERSIVMSQLRPVSKLEKIFFPFSVLVLTILFLPSAAPLIGMLMFGNLLKESGVVDRLSKAAQNEIINIVTIFLGLSVGSKLSADKFLSVETLGILALGAVAFMIGTATGVLMGKVLCKISGGKVNPLIGAAGVSAVPMAARVANKVGLESNPHNFLLMHAMGPNVAGVIGSAVAAGVLLAVVGG
ncbi:glutaconyl-CoA decarboxylase subunit beta [Solemya velum gill symbiont]|uniref:sodium ion-translocating decarboxylase subunit beta n=1 Tax=Solemya velum gill symbiont TaxID=2340 RepID=UPI0009984F97|nr:sodium ion-translocating decarboxylase subunit beta [Solemya velum gill symbiont]OOY40369.1 glutaconyl-CoA decarboxylase subunit beta [Solemya velum gill symbiont]